MQLAGFSWIEPSGYPVRLRSDLLLRTVVALSLWVAGTGLAFAVIVHHKDQLGLWVAAIIGFFVFCFPCLLIMFNRRKHAAGRVSVREDDIYRFRQYTSIEPPFTCWETSTWPYEAINSCVIVPHSELGKSFSVMLLDVDSELEIVGIRKKVDLRKLAKYIDSKGVPVEFGQSIPADFTKGLNPKVVIVVAVLCAVSFLAGSVYRAVHVGDQGADQEDAVDAGVEETRQENTPDLAPEFSDLPAELTQPAPASKPTMRDLLRNSQRRPSDGFRGRNSGQPRGP